MSHVLGFAFLGQMSHVKIPIHYIPIHLSFQEREENYTLIKISKTVGISEINKATESLTLSIRIFLWKRSKDLQTDFFEEKQT